MSNKSNFYEKHRHKIKFLFYLAEIFLLSYGFLNIWLHFYSNVGRQTLAGRGGIVLLLNYALVIYLVYQLTDSYSYGQLRLSYIQISKTISICISDFFEYFIVSLMANRLVIVYPMLLHLVVSVLISFVFTYFETFLYHHYHSPRDVLLIYGSEKGLAINKKLMTRPDRYSINSEISASTNINQILKEIDKHDSIILNDIEDKKRNTIVKYCYSHYKRIYIVPKLSDILISSSEHVNTFDTPLELIKVSDMTMMQRIIKRTADVVLSLIALIITLPITLVISLLIYLEDKGPVFFIQKRITDHEKEFNLIKFRSMRTDAEKGGYDIKTMRAGEDDPRITKIGKFIRACRIDELPQILNILKGDMSIVGPRPERIENHIEYSKEIKEWPLRTRVKAGLTGYAQIFGKYNTTPYDKLRLDLTYISEYSLLLDIKLIFMTVAILFRKESTEGFSNQEVEEIMHD